MNAVIYEDQLKWFSRRYVIAAAMFRCTKTKDLSSATLFRPPAIVHYFIRCDHTEEKHSVTLVLTLL